MKETREELLSKLFLACAVFALRESYDNQIRKRLDVITESHNTKMSLQKKKGEELEKANKCIEEKITPVIK